MRRLPALFIGFLAAFGSIGAAAKHLGGADRQLDPFSPFVREVKDRPLPADWQGVAVIANLMTYAHEVEAAAALMRYVERGALLEILGEPAPRTPARVEDAIREMSGADKAVEALRVRVLDKALLAQPIQELDPALAPTAGGGVSFRHEGGSVWARDDGGTQRVIGVRIVNPRALEVLGGFLELQVGPPARALRFSCRFNQPIEAGASRAMLCSGDRSRPIEDVHAAIRAAAGEPVKPFGQYEIAYRLRGARFAVGGATTGFIGEQPAIEKAALDMLHDQSCGARRACGAAVAEGLENPLLAGFVLGIAACFVVLLVAWIAGMKAAAAVGSGLVVVLALLSVAFVIFVAVVASKAHILLVLLLTGAAMGHMGDMGVGFVAGVVVFIFVARALGTLVRRVRGAAW